MISLKYIALGIKTNFFLCRDSFQSEFYNKCQNLSGHTVAQLLKILTLNNKSWEQGQESHYIQPSNLSSALDPTKQNLSQIPQ